MRHISTSIVALLLLLTTAMYGANVKTGIEVLREDGFKVLEGKRVGLTTNPTGVDSQLKSTIDILWEAQNVNLVALYGPEHGVRGNVHAGDHVDNEVDKKTGLESLQFPVFCGVREIGKEPSYN